MKERFEGFSDVILLGEGGSAQVYRAHRADGSAVVLKALKGLRAPGQLRHEYELLSTLTSPHVVRVEELREGDEGVVLVLEDFEGVAVRDLLLQGPLALGQTLSIGLGAARGLAAAQHAGVLHLDVWPGNLLVGADGETRVADFGLAQLFGSAPRAVFGHLAYAAPEVASLTARTLDGRSDLYSLGAVLFECLAGSPPFPGDDALHLAWAHVAAPIPTPPGPEALARIIHTLLEKDPEARYQTADGLVSDLERLSRQHRSGEALWLPKVSSEAPRRMSVSHRLHGREQDFIRARAAFASAESGRPVVLSVEGEAGVGKSSFVDGLRRGLPEHIFADAKFEAQGMEPLRMARDILGGIAHDVLKSSEAVLHDWHERLSAAAGVNAGLLVSLVPSFGALLGPVRRPAVTTPLEQRARFRSMFHRLLGAIGGPRRPFVLVLDDVQWADADQRAAIETLMIGSLVRHLFLVTCWRPEEAPPEWPALLARVEAAGTAVCRVRLSGLSSDAVEAVVAESLGTREDPVPRLAAAIHARTHGNPLFVARLLEAAAQSGALVRVDDGWRFTSLAQVVSADAGLGALLRAGLAEFSAQTRERLSIAALLGAVSPELLAQACAVPVQQLYDDLRPARDAGLVSVAPQVRFTHDTLMEAARTWSEPAAQAARVWRRLDGAPTLVRASVAVVAGRELPGEERPVARRVLLDAGVVQLGLNTGFARRLLLAARDLEEAGCADGVRVDTRLALGEAALLEADFERVDGLIREISDSAELVQRPLAHARAFELRARAKRGQLRYDESIECSLDALKALSVSLPASMEDCLAARVPPEADLDALPEATSDEDVAALRLLGSLIPSVLVARPQLFPFVAAAMTLRSLERGVTSWSSFGLTQQAMLLIEVDPTEAYQSGVRAQRLFRRFADPTLEGRTRFVFNAYLRSLGEPWENMVTEFFALVGLSQAAADPEFEVYSLFNAAVMHPLVSGAPLQVSLELAAGHTRRLEELGWGWTSCFTRPAEQFARNLAGIDAGGFTLNGTRFDERADLAAVLEKQIGTAAYVHKVVAAWLRLLGGDAEGALACLADARAWTAVGTQFLVSWACFVELMATAEVGGSLESVRERLTQLERWARSAPANHAARVALGRGALLEREGRVLEALQAYELAAREALRWQRPADEGLARERAARLMRLAGLDGAARLEATQAALVWHRWGAVIKERQVTEGFALPPAGSEGSGSERTRDALELQGLSRTVAALAGEQSALATAAGLVSATLELTGAERATFVRTGPSGGVVEAVATATGVEVPGPEAPAPRSIAAYVGRTGEVLVLDDVARHQRWAEDPELQAAGTRSLLALPVTAGRTTHGALVLEHSRLPGLFSAARSVVAQAQALARGHGLQRECERLTVELRSTHQATRQEEQAHRALLVEREALQGQLLQAQKLETLGQLSSGVAHDFNNLLTVFGACAELISEEAEDPAAVARYAGEVRAAVQSAAQLTRQLLTFSRRSVSGGSPAVFLLPPALERLSPLLRRLAGPRVTLQLSAMADCSLSMDVGSFDQALVNLVVNARDAMPDGGTVTITVTRHREFVRVAVKDSGTGIRPEVLPRLFERLFTTKEEGTGLGLATVHAIAERAGGRVLVESEWGHGATFTLELPASAPALPAVPTGASGARTGRAAEVLLVEPDAALRRLLQHVLERRGHRVIAADRLPPVLPSGLEFLVTEWLLPEGTGPSLASRLRLRFPGLRVLYISSVDTGGESAIGERVLSKPFAPADLVAALDELC